jgi:hypothetical protein
MLTGSFHDPARAKLLETRKSVVNGWLDIADALDLQRETVLAGDVRHFARHLPAVLTDRQKLGQQFAQHLWATDREATRPPTRVNERTR